MTKRGIMESLAAMFDSWGLNRVPPSKKQQIRALWVWVPLEGGQRLHVGTLSEIGDEFVFEYAEEFKRTHELPSIPGFPNRDEVYRSPTLWPFFQAHLPPPNRADVARVLDRKNVAHDDLFRQLGEFGRRAITTPYQFDPEPSKP